MEGILTLLLLRFHGGPPFWAYHACIYWVGIFTDFRIFAFLGSCMTNRLIYGVCRHFCFLFYWLT